MMDFSMHMIARTEHDHMTHSLAPVSEYATPTNDRQSGRVARNLSQLLHNLGSNIASLSARRNVGSARESVSVPGEL